MNFTFDCSKQGIENGLDSDRSSELCLKVVLKTYIQTLPIYPNIGRAMMMVISKHV